MIDDNDHTIIRWMIKFLLRLVERRRRGRDLTLTLTFDEGYTVEGGNVMALTLTSVQQASLTVSAVDAKGNPAPIENVVYQSSDTSIVELQPDAEDSSVAWVVAVGSLGNAQVTVAADADIGEGIKALTGLLDVTVVAAEAVAIAIETGVPEDQPAEPAEPTVPGAHPEHPIALPGEPTHPIAPGGGPTPEHPIAPGGIRPEHPIEPGGTPTHPIAPGGPEPTHPIAVPPRVEHRPGATRPAGRATKPAPRKR
jgi:hypothetical protein